MSSINGELLSICVFCGSRPGVRDDYTLAARALGGLLAQKGITLVYGGGHVGLMGEVADAALAAKGKVVGVIPRSLHEKEIAHKGISELIVVETMHQRKALMAEKADAFIALPGGAGTFEEFFEIVTWAQLGIHRKPVGLLNVCGYYDPLIHQFDRSVTEGFVRKEHRDLVEVAASPVQLLEQLYRYQPVSLPKWMDRTET